MTRFTGTASFFGRALAGEDAAARPGRWIRPTPAREPL